MLHTCKEFETLNLHFVILQGYSPFPSQHFKLNIQCALKKAAATSMAASSVPEDFKCLQHNPDLI